MGPADSIFGSMCLCIYSAAGGRQKKGSCFSVTFEREKKKNGESHHYFLGDYKMRKIKEKPTFIFGQQYHLCDKPNWIKRAFYFK